jgi:hypothetical protein
MKITDTEFKALAKRANWLLERVNEGLDSIDMTLSDVVSDVRGGIYESLEKATEDKKVTFRDGRFHFNKDAN